MAERTYYVTVGPKQPEHPFYGRGSDLGYLINGQSGPTLYLNRGETVRFVIDAPNHPFYLTNSPIGGQNRAIGSLLEPGQDPTEVGVLLFYVDDDLPDSFYYQCDRHPMMGGYILLDRDEPDELGPGDVQSLIWQRSYEDLEIYPEYQLPDRYQTGEAGRLGDTWPHQTRTYPPMIEGFNEHQDQFVEFIDEPDLAGDFEADLYRGLNQPIYIAPYLPDDRSEARTIGLA